MNKQNLDWVIGVGALVAVALAVSVIPYARNYMRARRDGSCVKEVVSEYVEKYKALCQERVGRPNCELPPAENENLKNYYTAKQIECHKKYLNQQGGYFSVELKNLTEEQKSSLGL